MTKPMILCFSSSDWEGKWGSRQQVMQRLAQRGYPVLFIERQIGLEHLWRYPEMRRHKWRRWREGRQTIAPNLTIVSPPLLLPGRYHFRTVARINQWIVIQWTQAYLRRNGLQPQVVWVYRPEDGGLFGHFGETLRVYHCIDEFRAGTVGRKRAVIDALERETLTGADIVFTNSLLTHREKLPFNVQTHRIPSGADVAHFARALDKETVVPEAIAQIPPPVAGYVGNINDKLDIALLTAVAQRLPNWSFVFVGQAYPQAVDLHPLQALPNVYFLGRQPFAAVPGFVKSMQICLLPYTDSEYTRYRSPLKLYEYLAAGKPVVSTSHPEVAEFAEWVTIADDATTFAAAIVTAAAADSPAQQQQRAAIGRCHAWDARVDIIERVLQEHWGELP